MSTSPFAARLKLLRESVNLTQAQLAERAGMHQFGIAKLEQGVREPSWATVQALAKALGVDCTAFTVEDAGGDSPATKRGPGRPRKVATETAEPEPAPSPPAPSRPKGKAKGAKKPRGKKGS